jgi:hypothetical protein
VPLFRLQFTDGTARTVRQVAADTVAAERAGYPPSADHPFEHRYRALYEADRRAGHTDGATWDSWLAALEDFDPVEEAAADPTRPAAGAA